MSSIDFEYIPPNEDAAPSFSSKLPSAYPPDTPAGLRGEAVRSALKSGRCIAWDLSDTAIAQGWIHVSGKGTRAFLNNKFSQTIDSNNSFTKVCLLTAKGRVIDQVCLVTADSKEQAYLLTSPGHEGSQLFDRLDPLIFPMDQVKLEECNPRIITLVSTKLEHVQEAIRKFVMPLFEAQWEFPSADASMFVSNDKLVVLPHSVLPSCAGQGYTLIINDSEKGKQVWQAMVGDETPEGPVGIGAREYETLRIEAGLPAFGMELTGGDKTKSGKAPGPLELHWQEFLDLDKGCYLGQEGVASVLKNVRGPPRSLYSVVFDDDENVYEHQSEGDKGNVDNLTVLPHVGQELFVLGSNEQISVGTLTSVAEPGGTGEPAIVGLALVRRADSILKQMKDMNLELGSSTFRERDPSIKDGDGIIAPPPLDPLDGLEVIAGGTFTVGKLQMVPSRRHRRGQNMFEDEEEYLAPDEDGSVMGVIDRSASPDSVSGTALEEDPSEEDDLKKTKEEAEKAQAEAEATAAEAKRKEEKMAMLKKRAEEAMARRKKKQK